MKRLFFALLHRAGVARLVAWVYRRRVVFLCYHSVTKWPHPVAQDPELHTPHASFAAQLDYLQRRHRVIPLAEYLAARREGRRLPDYSAVLTFDDGTRNFLTVVAPLLAERGLSATAFVITRKASERAGAPPAAEWTREDDQLYLSWDEVRSLMRQPGVEIGSHSSTHPDLTALTAEEARRELAESLAAVAEQTGNARPALAYPHGRTSAQVCEIARALGYACAFTGELGANDMETDLYALRRVVIAGDDDLPTFVARVSGVTWGSGRVRGALRRAAASPSPSPTAAAPAPRHPETRPHDDARVVQMKKPSPGSIP
ncbi:MAG TPA: polysaccharide deacetylase family protein [Pyrinomonadaceae bacterium]|jgi:peptidoglycan/xylan/chitin deacetylase (PgdA/CDA1 family)